MQVSYWLQELKSGLSRHQTFLGAYSVGSIAKKNSDEFSDIDLIVVAQERKLEIAVFQITRLVKKISGGLLYSRVKTWKRFKIAKIDLLVPGLVQVDILVCEPDSPVKIFPPFRSLLNSSKIPAGLFGTKSHGKNKAYEPLKYGKKDLPFDILAALRAILRGQKRRSASILKGLSERI